jgi:hypothetical protein
MNIVQAKFTITVIGHAFLPGPKDRESHELQRAVSKEGEHPTYKMCKCAASTETERLLE